MAFRDWLLGLFGRRGRVESESGTGKGQKTHVIILDGTRSSLADGFETNAGLTYKLLCEVADPSNLHLHYEAGIQWRHWKTTRYVVTGKGINRQIERAYAALAKEYAVNDRIILIGYSRGAFAVRSLAGVIDRVGLLRSEETTEPRVAEAYRHYRKGEDDAALRQFHDQYCHPDVRIDAVAVWDTVKALGWRFPILWRFTDAEQSFHNDQLGSHVLHGFQALALDERRLAFRPLVWRTPEGWNGHVEQVWFRGVHSDIGGQIGPSLQSRPLSNIPLVWMLTKLEDCGVVFPANWKDRFEQDVHAPSVGAWRGWGKLFVLRRKRVVGQDTSERIHPTVLEFQR